MPYNTNKIEPPKPWEALGTFFGYFAVAKDVPEILRTLNLTKIIPSFIKTFLLKLNSSADFWLLLAFTIAAMSFLLYVLPKKNSSSEDSSEDRITTAIRAYGRKSRFFQILRSFGLILVREFLLDLLKIAIYGTFRRPSNWPPEVSRKDYLDRISFTDGIGFEYQYSKDFSHIIFRSHPANESAYSEPVSRKPKFKEIVILLVASNYFPLWLLGYLTKRLIHLALGD